MKYSLIYETIPKGFEVKSKEVREAGRTFLTIVFTSETPNVLSGAKVRLNVSAAGVRYRLTPKMHMLKACNEDWFHNLYKTSGSTGAPVETLMTNDDMNLVTVALSDTLNSVFFKGEQIEETCEYSFLIEPFYETMDKVMRYELTVLMDTTKKNYQLVLNDVVDYWGGIKGSQPINTPAPAKEVVYSTWYSFHQQLNQEALFEEMVEALNYGCKTLIIDDGWQTDDYSRGYAYCGDWEMARTKFPDFKEFVERLHEEDVKVMLWYSVPFIGERSKKFSEFKDMLIDPEANREWHVLDPRYKEVREFICSIYVQAVKEYDIDGFKLDFVDEFTVTPFSGCVENSERERISIEQATDCLMKQIIKSLKEIKPEILIEFRQTYNGPQMRSYGNIFRAVDCPFDDEENRIRVTDVRLYAGDSATHSDMLMWHKKETVENAALQLIAVLFSVPQISMRLNDLTKEHKRMLRFYLDRWKKYKNAFIEGDFMAKYPQHLYPLIYGKFDRQTVVTVFLPMVVELEVNEENWLVNATDSEALYINNIRDIREMIFTTYDAQGRVIKRVKGLLEQGINKIEVPISGSLELKTK